VTVSPKLKWGLIAGGVAFIVIVPMMRGGAKGGADSTALIQANTAWNQAANQLRIVQTQSAADVIMNRDQVTGRTTQQALSTVQNILANQGNVSLGMTESYNGIINARIYSDTTKAIEASRASVSKYIAKKQYKAAKHGANMNFAGNVVGAVGGLAQSALKAWGGSNSFF
jgi:hypothetical protein